MELPQSMNVTEDLKVFERNRTKPSIRNLGLALYFHGLSLRKTKKILKELGADITHVAIYEWVKKLGEQSKGISQEQMEMPSKIAIDETIVKQKAEKRVVYTAINPNTREILNINVYTTANILTTKAFLKETLEGFKDKPKTVLTDDATYYPEAFRQLGLNRVVKRHKDRNKVERWFQELKRRTQNFYNSFNGDSLKTLQNWLSHFQYLWNKIKTQT